PPGPLPRASGETTAATRGGASRAGPRRRRAPAAATWAASSRARPCRWARSSRRPREEDVAGAVLEEHAEVARHHPDQDDQRRQNAEVRQLDGPEVPDPREGVAGGSEEDALGRPDQHTGGEERARQHHRGRPSMGGEGAGEDEEVA